MDGRSQFQAAIIARMSKGDTVLFIIRVEKSVVVGEGLENRVADPTDEKWFRGDSRTKVLKTCDWNSKGT